MEQVLELKNIHYAYHNLEGETPALRGISFALAKGAETILSAATDFAPLSSRQWLP